MRAREFTINIPVHITINGDGEPEVNMDDQEDEDDVTSFVPPLQQKIELMKHAAGKNSKVIDQITADDDALS